MANANMCIPCCERNGFRALHCTQSSHNLFGFSLFPSPISGIGLNVGYEKNRIFRYRGNKCGAIRASSKGESDIRLQNGNVLENDFLFKPSFDEYVRVMESVRTSRYKKQPDDPNKLKMKENASAKSAESSSVSEIDNEKTKVTDVQGNVDVKNMFKRVDQKKLFNNAERVTRKKDLLENKFDNKRKGITRTKDEFRGKVTHFDSQVNDKQHEEQRKRNRLDCIEPKVRRLNNEALVCSKANTLDIKRERQRVCDESSMKTVERIWADGDTKLAKGALEVGKSGVQLARNYVPGEKVSGKKTGQSYQGLSKSGKPFIESTEESSLEVERAAFNNFDALDIMDKPRVSKMEMEERIQMLSKRSGVPCSLF